MRWLSDQAVERLRYAGSLPDLNGTRYALVETVGRGGMGVVYRVHDSELERDVALKVLDLDDPSGTLEARMLREARVLARLEHPGIVPVHEVGRLEDGRVFYTMKLVRGLSLDRHLERHAPSLRDRLRLFARICQAVAFAHDRGVLHRDLKPQNVMVGAFGEVLVMDWGVAKLLDGASSQETDAAQAGSLPSPSGSTVHGAVLGTPGYMSPEQARGAIAELDPRSDVYSLGTLLRFVLVGCMPGEATTVTLGKPWPASSPGRPARIDRRLASVVSKATSDEPGGRYDDVNALSRDVERYLDGQTVEAHPEGVFSRFLRFLQRHRVAVLLLLAYAVARALAIFLGR